ncbi:hypothetical protein HPC49_50505 [Pyxidicoccus fallax]|uniref:Lipoprotein n=1 Tax=Pyxidicoccus fallax TaxID=394095 RepID=A0A848LTP2_9BACT|nr:hypothetical protein [Pyxidicoccus fallax]NMO20972.1 hypothetical protein [Pyxidicoccus fallax]NPC86407.1 hypothetical protein [Pyxidicoccus fallax]
MRRLCAVLVVMVLGQALGGCSYFGYHKLEKPETLPAVEGEKVRLPESFEGAVELQGPSVAALEVAMRDFLPPGKKVRWKDGYAPLEECLSRRSTYDALVLPYGEGLFYVAFTPMIERCGLKTAILDGGAEYVVDGRGRVLRVR